MDLPAPSWTNLSRLISAMLLDDLRQYPNVPDLSAPIGHLRLVHLRDLTVADAWPWPGHVSILITATPAPGALGAGAAQSYSRCDVTR
jgi:hypothetical protein